MVEGDELISLLKEKKDKVRVEIDTDTETLNPFSSLHITISVEGEVIYKGDTIFKCNNLAGCFFCFSKDYSMVTLEKNREKLSFPASWKCLVWEGKPIFEDKYFERAIVSNLFIGQKGNYTFITHYNTLEINKGEKLFRIRVDNRQEFFAKELKTDY